MTRRRWIADQVSGNRAALLGEHAAHVARVLRAQVGQEFDIAADGAVRRGRILSVTESRVEFELGEALETVPAAQVKLALAIFKFDRMEWAIEKCTELGVARIVPFAARRTDSRLAAAAGKRVERWRRITREASEQARRVAPPEIADPVKLGDVLALAGETRVVLSEAETAVSLHQLCSAGNYVRGSSIVLAVGPEGGWTNEELQAFAQAGWKSASLGPTILRAETAAIAALAVIMAEIAKLSS
ncbi:MAG TPA: RsmE family RNA methyltransferase [Terriglobales bacterium]|nr:RsmE family RNA methyltransferase [Terriglobales bacterium]